MVKTPAASTNLSVGIQKWPVSIVEVSPEVLVVTVELERRKLAELMTEVTGGMEVGLSKQLPRLTAITGVALPRMIATLVPAGIVTLPQVYEAPAISVKAATTGPSALPSWNG